jgi:hypothetical protein
MAPLAVSISSPAEGAVLRGAGGPIAIAVSGGATLADLPGAVRITSVAVQIGANAQFRQAELTGDPTSAVSWRFEASLRLPAGPLRITARAAAGALTATATRNVTVARDTTAPTIGQISFAPRAPSTPPYRTTMSVEVSDDNTGVASVEWRLDGAGAFRPAALSGGAWRATLTLGTLGRHSVEVRATDSVGNQRARIQTVDGVDTAPPRVEITSPTTSPAIVTGTEAGATVTIEGAAADSQSGVAVVETAVGESGAFAQAKPRAPGDWSSWSASLVLPAPGLHTVRVRARDQAGNQELQQQLFEVALRFEPQAPGDVFSQRAYLEDLLDFAKRRIRQAPKGEHITPQLLAETFHQPFVDLADPARREVAYELVNQVRICVEVLRAYLGNRPGVEVAYRAAAYATLLRNLGTSYDEIRLARIADDEPRRDLAERLRIDLASTRPDQLDALFLPPDQISEQRLEQLFGLRSTRRDPLTPAPRAPAELLAWQLAYLRSLWGAQPAPLLADGLAPLPIIDPDLVERANLKNPVAGNSAFDLWQARQAQVADQRTQIKAMREAAPSQQAGYEQIVERFLAPLSALA